MRKRIRRLVLSLAAVVIALSINVLSVQAGNDEDGESCGVCVSTSECPSDPEDDVCEDVCPQDPVGEECKFGHPNCASLESTVWLECGPGEDGAHEN